MAIINGTINDDVLNGTSNDDTIDGGKGNDTINAGNGNDVVIYKGEGNDTVTFGAGNDTLKVSNISGWEEQRDGDDLIINSPGSSNFVKVIGAYSTSNRLENIEYTDISVVRLVSVNSLVPLSGNHLFAGTSGNDKINGGSASSVAATGYDGNDTMIGSTGKDYYFGHAGNDIIKTLADNDVLMGGSGNDTLNGGAGNDTIYTGAGDDKVYGEAGDDTIIQNGSGSQTYDGGSGTDTLKVDTSGGWVGTLNSSYPNSIEVNMATGIVGQTNNPNKRDTFTNMENITFVGSFDTLLTGDGNANIIIGGSGNDTIKGGDGNDLIYSEDGDDKVYGEGGDDTIFVSWGDDFEDGGSGVDTLATGGVSDTLTDVTYDLEAGGSYVTGTTPNSGKFTNFENFKGGINLDGEIVGSNWNMTIKGTGSDNDILTSNGNDIINSGAGNDTIFTSDGNDIINPGTGNDYIISGTGNDTINLVSDGIWGKYKEAWNINKSKSIFSVIKLEGKNKFHDVIDAGNGLDKLNLTSGSDAFFAHDTISPVNSNNNLIKDIFGNNYSDRAFSIEIINGGSGDDIIDLTSTDISIAHSMTINGDDGNDYIWSSDGADIINGGKGNDVIFGGKGIDELTGGAGSDIFEFANDCGNDIIKDFSIADGDQIRILLQSGDTDQVTLKGSNIIKWGNNQITLDNLTLSNLNEIIIHKDPEIFFTTTSSSDNESNTTKTIATINSSHAATREIKVDYKISGTAKKSGVDHNLADGFLTIAVGNTSPNSIIGSQGSSQIIINDTLKEDNETIKITLTNPVNAILSSKKIHTHTIIDNDNSYSGMIIMEEHNNIISHQDLLI